MNRLVQALVSPFIRATALPDPLPALEGEAVFVVPKRYGADRVAVRQSLAAKGIAAQRILTLPEVGARRKQFDKAIGGYLEADADIQLVPVSVFWGRSPEREGSVWRVIFSDSWVVPGFIRRLLVILTQGRRVECFVSPALPLAAFKASAAPGEDLTRKLKLLLRTHFRRQREAVVGPDLSHKRILQRQVLSSPVVQQALAEEKGKNKEAKAKKYLNEIASDYSYSVVRLFDRFLNWLWARLYRGVKVSGMQVVHDLATDHELVYVPCHRSHIDYLLLSYVIYYQGLMPPHIAAGINLNMPVVGPILRRGGAFFIRRQFRDNQLYRAVLEAYLSSMCQKGFPIEYFIEGGRSRTGRLLQPKAGMLVMTLNSIRGSNARPLAFIPVYIGYERIIESHSYINEMYGGAKKKESIGSLLSARHYLKENFGRVYVSFGSAILERDIWPQIGYQDSDLPPAGSDAFRSGVDWLARRILTNINSHAVVTPVNLVATVLLGTPKHAMLERQISESLRGLAIMSRVAGLRDTLLVGSGDWSKEINTIEKMGLVERNTHALGDIILLNQRQALSATYLRNNTLHCFMLAGLVASVLITRGRASLKRLQELSLRFYPFLRRELFLPWDEAEVPTVVRQYVAHLVDLGLVIRSDRYFEAPDNHTKAHMLLSIVASVSKGTLERYFITAQMMTSRGAGYYTAKTLEEDCVLMAQRLSLLYSFHAPDFFDKNLFRTFIQGLIDMELVHVGEGDHLFFDQRLLIGERQFMYVLAPEVRLGILQITRQ